MKVAILAGGLGTRLAEETETQAEADGRDRRPADPLAHHEALRHATASSEFVVAWATRARSSSTTSSTTAALNGSLTIDCRERQVAGPSRIATEDWIVHLVDTGLDTTPAAASSGSQPWLGDETFMVDLRRRRLATSTSTSCSRSTARTAGSRP